MTRGRAGALALVTSAMFFTERQRLVALAAKNRLPTVYPWHAGVDAGGLMPYAPHLPDLYRRAATYVDKILKGVRPGDLPVEQPTKFDLVINLKTARALGVTIPASLLARADRVVEKGAMSTWVAARTLTSACSGRYLALLGAAAEAGVRQQRQCHEA